MGHDRGSESQRSLSGGRSRNYVPRRSARADYRSPNRPHRGPDYYRRAYRNRSPDYGEKYRRRSPSGARYGRDPRPYRGGRNPAYRHSRSRSPLPRRSRSAESAYRNERYVRNDVPSARFGSRASYLRSKEANRVPSRSPSRAGRRKSPLRGEQTGRQDVSQRSESRGRYRERRDERSRNYVSPGREPRPGRALDNYDSPVNRGDTRRTDKYTAMRGSEDRSVSQHNRSHRPSPRMSRGRKTSPQSQRSRSQGRNSKWSRSASRSGSWARRRHAATTSRRSPVNERRSSRRSGSGGRGAQVANTSRHSQVAEGTLTRRSPVGCRGRDETLTRRSPTHDKAVRRPSTDESTVRIDGAPRRSSQSDGRLHRASGSISRERDVVEATKRSNQQEMPSRSRSLCRSADCPTPDLVSSRPDNVDSKGTSSARPSLGRQEKRTPGQETSPKRAKDNVLGERSADGGPPEAPRRRSEARASARQSPSVSRSPSSRTRAPAVQRDEGKERAPSCPAAPPTEQPAPEKSRESREFHEAKMVSGDTGACVQKRCSQEEEPIQDQDEPPTKMEDQPPPSMAQSSRSSPTQRHDERRQSDGPAHDDDVRFDGRPVEASSANSASATSTDCLRTTHEPGNPRARLPSEEIGRNVEVDRTTVKRRIVATEPLPPLESADIYRTYREPSPRGYSRFQAQRFPRDRGERFLPVMNRFQPFQPVGQNAWNRLERDERFDFPQPVYPINTGRSVRLVPRRGDRNLLITAQQRFRNATPSESHHVQVYNGMFQQHSAQPNQRHLRRPPVHLQPGVGRNRKMAGIVGRGVQQERRNAAAAASNADGKWSHDLFEQLSSEPERKRQRFNLYGETLERVDD